jgi:hypothetical protein
MGTKKVRQAKPHELNAAVGILVQAFDRDPFNLWLYPEPGYRLQGDTVFFSQVLRERPSGALIEVTDSLEGVALWYPPNASFTIKPPYDVSSTAAELFLKVAVAMPAQPFWYLADLGTLRSNSGAGTALMRHRLGQLPGQAALWTANLANLAFYERF